MSVFVQFMTLDSPYRKAAADQKFDTLDQARAAVEKYIEGSGYTDLKYIADEYEDEGGRFTARTPGGRAGRNVAYVDFGGSDE